MPHVITEEQSYMTTDSNIISINLKDPRMSHCEPLYMATTRAFDIKQQLQKAEVKPRTTLNTVRYRSTGYRPSVDYSQNKEKYKKIPDISEKELRENFYKRLTMGQKNELEF